MNSFVKFLNRHTDRFYKNVMHTHISDSTNLFLNQFFPNKSESKSYYLDHKKFLDYKFFFNKYNDIDNNYQYGLNYSKITANFYNIKFLRLAFRKFKIYRKSLTKFFNLKKFLVYPVSFSYGRRFKKNYPT